MSVQNYSPSKVFFTIGGYNVNGWDRIIITPDAPSFKQINGIRGKNARVRVGNTSATIILEVPMTSILNPVFQEIINKDEKFGSGRLEIQIADKLGFELFKSTRAYIEAPPEEEYTEKITTRQWRIKCLDSERSVGGGSAMGSLIDSVTSLF